MTDFRRASVIGRSVPSVAAALTKPASPVPEVVPLAPPVPRDTFVVRYAGKPAVERKLS